MGLKEDLEVEKLKAEIRNLSANTQKVYSEIRKTELERLLYPAVVTTSIALVLLGVLKLIS